MCGMIYCHNLRGKNVAPKVIKKYYQQRSRGHEGFGLYLPNQDKMAHNPKENKMLKHLKKTSDNIMMFHHRWPTSTANVRNACHPFSTKEFFKNNYILIHNGVVNNSRDLKEEHEKLGIKYISEQEDGRFNDSEALLWDVALMLEGRQKDLKATGSIAFICYKHKVGDKNVKNAKLYFAHNYASPLMLSRGKNHMSLTSEVDKGNPAKEVLTHKLFCYNYKTDRLTQKNLTILAFTSYVSDRSWAAPHNYKGWDPDETPIDIPVKVQKEIAEEILNQADEKDLADRLKRSFAYYMKLAKGNYESALDLAADAALQAQEEDNIEEYDYLEMVFNFIVDTKTEAGEDVDPAYANLRLIGFQVQEAK